MTLFQKMVVMRHVAQALAYLHGLPKPILHLNVQPSSVHLGSKAGIIAKLGQFGVACVADELFPATSSSSSTSNQQNTGNSADGPVSGSSYHSAGTNATSHPTQNMQHHSHGASGSHSVHQATSFHSSQPDPSHRANPSPSHPASSNNASSTTQTQPRGIPMIFQSNRGDKTPTDSPSTSPSCSPIPSLPSSLSSGKMGTAATAAGFGGTTPASHLSSNAAPASLQLKPPTPQILATMRGAPLYNPPEAFRGEPYTTKSDVYSFGLAMTEVICGTSPFASVRSLAGLVAAIQAPPVFPDDLPAAIGDLLTQCRQMDPEKRPTFAQIIVTINSLFVPIFVHENVPWARQFWLDHFEDAISVRWSDFVSAMIRRLDLPTTPNEITFRGVQKSKDTHSGIATRRLHCLKQLFFPGLTEDTDFMRTINLWIDIDKYGHLMGTFSDENTCLENFLDGLANLIETRWFHGDATGSSGPHRLSPDTFLIRLSAPAQNSLRPPNCWFTFSLKTATGNFVRETRIQRIPGKSECILANSAREVYPSLFALAESKGKPYGLAPVPSFLQSTLHPVSAEYTTDDEE